MHKKILFLVLFIFYLLYSVLVYTKGTEQKLTISQSILKGKMLYQKYNCTACHQMYGLGGYMGPDLTNIISAQGKGETYATAIIKNGMGKMPNFKINEDEIYAIIAYLKYVDSSGSFPIKNFSTTWYGTILKNE